MAKKNNVGATDEVNLRPPQRRSCGTMAVHERLLRTVPGYREARDNSENHAWRAAFSPIAGRTGCTRIPVVVHVIYKTAQQNVSDAQIKSQIEVLNADFRKKNADVSTVPAAFQALAADSRIEFELAKTDPAGNPTTGITRTRTNVTAFSDDDAMKFGASGGTDAWPRDQYLNIWVCQLGGGLLGYAQFPGGPANTDGVVVLHSAFGTTGTAAAPFNLGRTTTHEVGHWLNLRHIWGDDGTGCSGSDFVADTPNQAGPNYGTPTFPSVSCSNGPNGDMFMNYMDYVDDVVMVMFSSGQVTRIQAALDSSRSTIGTAIPCGKTLSKDVVKEPIKELPKENPKDHIKEAAKELPKENPKEFTKEPPKDAPKDGGKDWPKDPPKDFPKDWVKDNPKEFVKEPIKDGPKDPPLDTVKNFISDLPPKSISDPPKSFMEPPIDIFAGLIPGLFGQGGPGGGFNLPFVLGTGGPQMNKGAQGGCGCNDQNRTQHAAIAGACLQLLTHYSRLHAAGMLDQSGMAAWNQVASTYRQLQGIA